MPNHFDAIIIGTGQAGPPLARRLVAAGRRVAIVERAAFGGTCVNTGCVPTKALVASAYAAHIARRAADFGVRIDGEIRVDVAAAMERAAAISAQSRMGLESSLDRLDGCTVVRGHARFTAAKTIAVGEETMSAEQVFINVGGRALVPPMPGLEMVEFLTNSSILRLRELPEHLVIIGGSYIGLEFGQMFRRFGSDVTVIEKGARLVGREDPDISDAIRAILEREGITVRTDANCIAVTRDGAHVVADVDCERGESAVRGTHLLVAVGRRANTDDLGLEVAGIDVDPRGNIVVDDELRTSADGVWAIGDCNGKGAFTHTSYNDYEIVAANLLDGGSRRVSGRVIAYALYIDPPLARVGMNEAEARSSKREVLAGMLPMDRVGRAREKGETDGMMKVLVDATTREILGATILGTSGDEAIHAIIDTIASGGTTESIARAMHIHPTVSELIPTLIGSLAPLDAP
jgi:pyruvate/2-oxoglutarate dehydrogenase complex dihydrolipoamide dehydrogenase (E3) component